MSIQSQISNTDKVVRETYGKGKTAFGENIDTVSSQKVKAPKKPLFSTLESPLPVEQQPILNRIPKQIATWIETQADKLTLGYTSLFGAKTYEFNYPEMQQSQNQVQSAQKEVENANKVTGNQVDNYEFKDLLDQGISNTIDSVFGDKANEAKRVLRHTIDGKIKGENTNFVVDNIDIRNKNGSIDRGLFRINSDTFDDLWNRSGGYWRKRMLAAGIDSWDDMNNPNLNIKMAKIIYDEASYEKNRSPWDPWYAAPSDQRSKLGQKYTNKFGTVFEYKSVENPYDPTQGKWVVIGKELNQQINNDVIKE